MKAFARDMVREHTAFQEESDRLAHDLAVIPQLPLNEGTTLQAAATRTALTGARGAAFDRAYLDAEVTQHESTLQLLQRATTAAENARLRAMLEAAIPTVQSHLDRAKALRRTLGVSAG